MIAQNKITKKTKTFGKPGHHVQKLVSLKSNKFSRLLPNSKATLIGQDKAICPLLDKINKRISYQEKRLEKLPTPKTPRLAAPKDSTQFNRRKRKPSKKNIATVSVLSSRNNTLLTLSYPGGRVLKSGWVSAGSVGFKNSRKSSLYASQAAAKSLITLAKQQGIRGFYIKLRGLGRAKGAVVRVLNQSKLKIWAIRECTPTVHNGCRSPKMRRI